MMEGKLTLITSTVPAVLGKTYRLGDASELVKETAANMVSGSYEVRAFTTANDLTEVLVSVRTDQAITASLPANGIDRGSIVTARAKADNPGAISRTKEDFSLVSGQPGLLILDYDPPSDKVLDRDTLWKALQSVFAGVEAGGVVWWCSGSSHIHNGDTQVQGLKGQRFYVLIQDLSDTARAAEVLHQRLWVEGYGHCMVSRAGSLLERGLFDMAMQQAARLDFIGGAVCIEPLSQKRPPPEILADGGFLDTRKALPDLTPAEETAYRDRVERAKRELSVEAEGAKALWMAERRLPMVQSLMQSGLSASDAEDRATRSLESALNGGVLLGDFRITLDNGECVTVGEVLDNKERYHGKLTKDPVEPGYQNGKTCGKLYLYGSRPVLTSRAHGGRDYQLRRQPARLLIQRGSKAQTATDIMNHLADEPDVFIRGGVLVQIGDSGHVRVLTKPALTHLVQTRMAFYSWDGRAERPTDLGSDVVEMVMAICQ